MNLEFQPLGRESAVSGERFVAGERITSFLFRGEGGVLARADVLKAEADNFQPEGEVVCRWNQTVRDRSDPEADARKLSMQSAEAVFLALFEGPLDTDEAKDLSAHGATAEQKQVLKHLLALMLERRRVLRRVSRGTYWHPKLKRRFEVADVTLEPETLMALSDQLSLIVEPQVA